MFPPRVPHAKRRTILLTQWCNAACQSPIAPCCFRRSHVQKKRRADADTVVQPGRRQTLLPLFRLPRTDLRSRRGSSSGPPRTGSTTVAARTARPATISIPRAGRCSRPHRTRRSRAGPATATRRRSKPSSAASTSPTSSSRAAASTTTDRTPSLPQRQKCGAKFIFTCFGGPADGDGNA